MNASLFLFYATTVNIPMGPYMPQNYSHGAYKFMMQQSKHIFILFSNAMLM
jgi:hypothetical protein